MKETPMLATPPAPPADLSDDSKRLWAEIVPEQVSPGRLEMFVTAFRCRDRLSQVRAALDRGELLVETARTGAQHLNPLAKLETELRRQFASLWGEQLGLRFDARIDGMAGL